jgi:hypothetical protein
MSTTVVPAPLPTFICDRCGRPIRAGETTEYNAARHLLCHRECPPPAAPPERA